MNTTEQTGRAALSKLWEQAGTRQTPLWLRWARPEAVAEAVEEVEAAAEGGLPVQEDGITCTRCKEARPPAAALVSIAGKPVI